MEATAVTKYVRMSPFKARQVMRHVNGKDYNDAIELVTLADQKLRASSSKHLSPRKQMLR